MPKTYKVYQQELERFTKRVFTAYGVQPDEAEIVAHTMVEANLRGVHTHGVMRIGIYLERMRKGGTGYNRSASVVSETPTTALLDGGNGLGAVISRQAVALARQKAAAQNVGLVSVRMSNHFGIGSYWAQSLAADDMIGFACSNVEPLIPATGGKAPTIGNNPFAFAVPGKKYPPICLDMACSVVAGGKMFDYRLRNQEMPPGWFLDKDGNPTTDPFAASMVLPFGGYKGYIIAVMVEAMTSLLSGGNFGRDLGSQYGDLENPNHTSAFFAAVKISAFRDLEAFRDAVDGYIEYLHSIPTVDGVDSVRYPGELEELAKARSMLEGVELPANLVDELIGIADDLQIPQAEYLFLKAIPVE